MNAIPTPTSSSANDVDPQAADGTLDPVLLMPTETDIYILPDGQVVFADLPAELSDLAKALGDVEPVSARPAQEQ